MRRGVPTVIVVLLVWAAIGFTFAYDRGYVRHAGRSCSAGASVLKTTALGPLNYLAGVNRAVKCT